jgi:hypothetical protein
MQSNYNINFIYNKILFVTVSVFLVLTTITFSWIPLIILLPILLLMLFFKILYIKPNFTIYLFILVLMGIILYTVNHQIIYIEWARNILIALLIPTVYLIFIDIKYETLYKFLYIIFLSSLFVIFFIILVSVPQNFDLFFGERRGFTAKEFLIFGREYPFSLGVTHLNIYINYALTFLLITFINNIYKYNKKLLYFLFILIISIALLTQSRSPVLFFFVIILIYRQYIYTQRVNKITYFVIRLLFIISFSLFAYLIFYFYQDQIVNSDRLDDTSRFIFWIKGFNHMMDEPWGNSLLYTDPTMPLLNYHNTFLALGNRIGLVFFILAILYFIYVFFIVKKIFDIKIRYSLYLLLYFCFHNFMIEDIIKFDYFVLILFFAMLPIAKNFKGAK